MKKRNNNTPLQWHTEQRELGELIPYENNPRQMTEKEAADLEASLDKFDLVEIPAINLDNKLIAGHMRTRLLIAKHGVSHKIDVRVPNRMLTPEEFDEYNIRSNKNTGSWDMDKLANLFDINDLKEWGFTDKDFSFSLPTAEESDEEEYAERFEVVAECKDEEDQMKIYNTLQEMGYKCRILTL